MDLCHPNLDCRMHLAQPSSQIYTAKDEWPLLLYLSRPLEEPIGFIPNGIDQR